MKKKTGCIATVALIVVTVIGVFVALMLAKNRSERAVNATLSELHSLGFATSAAEFAPLPADATQNAAPLYQSAIALLAKTNLNNPGFAKRISGKALLSEEEIATYRPALEVARVASLRPRSVFLHDWTKPMAVSFSEYADIKKLARAFHQRAVFRAARGDEAGSFDDIQTIIRISNHLGEGRTLIAALVQVATRAIAMRAIEEVVTQFRATPTSLANAKRTLALLKPVSAKGHFQGELIFERGTVETLRNSNAEDAIKTISSTDGEASLSTRAFVLAARVPAMLNEMDLVCLKSYIKLHKALPDDPEDTTAMAEAAATIDHDMASHENELRYSLANIIMPSLIGFSSTFGADVARRRTLGCLLDALEKHPRPSGLVTRGRAALDPFSGSALIMRSNPHELTVYSVGQNKTDDGGDLKSRTSKDIIATYPRPLVPER